MIVNPISKEPFPVLPTTGVKSRSLGAVNLMSSTLVLIRIGCKVDVGTEGAQGSTNGECWSSDSSPRGSREAATTTRLFIAVILSKADLLLTSNSVKGCVCEVVATPRRRGVRRCHFAVLANNLIECDNVGCDCCGDVDNVSDELRLDGRLSNLRCVSKEL